MNPALPSTYSQMVPIHPFISPRYAQAIVETQGAGRHQGSYPTTQLHIFNVRAGKHCISPPESASMGLVR